MTMTDREGDTLAVDLPENEKKVVLGIYRKNRRKREQYDAGRQKNGAGYSGHREYGICLCVPIG